MFFSLAVSLILSALDSAVKNPEKKAKYRKSLLEIAAKIVELYGETEVNRAVVNRQ